MHIQPAIQLCLAQIPLTPPQGGAFHLSPTWHAFVWFWGGTQSFPPHPQPSRQRLGTDSHTLLVCTSCVIHGAEIGCRQWARAGRSLARTHPAISSLDPSWSHGQVGGAGRRSKCLVLSFAAGCSPSCMQEAGRVGSHSGLHCKYNRCLGRGDGTGTEYTVRFCQSNFCPLYLAHLSCSGWELFSKARLCEALAFLNGKRKAADKIRIASSGQD